MTRSFRVLISDEMSPRAAEVLSASPQIDVDVRPALTAGDLLSVIGQYRGLLVRSRTKVTGEVVRAAAQLEIIGRAGIGVDNIDVVEASRRGILVENAPSGNAVTTAEHALSLLFALARHVPQATASMKAGRWEKASFQGRELWAKTLGVVGLGNIGRIVADRARGLKMHVIAHDPFIGREAAERLGVELVTMDDLLAQADFLTLHMSLTSTTRNLFSAEAFAKMKPGVLLVNAARGGIVDEDALFAALESGQVGGAALDVFATEPPGAGNRLVGHPRVVCTPHLGASTDEAQEKVAIEVAEQLRAYVERGEVINAVNAAVVPNELRQRLAPWFALGRSLGSLVAQLARATSDCGFIDELAVEVTGEPGELGLSACANSVLVGLLKNFLEVPINEINAPVIARDRGLEVAEVKRAHGRDLVSGISVTATSGDSVRCVKGTLYHVGDRVEPRVIQIDNFLVEAVPRGRLLVVLNEDRPGVIGRVGTLLGQAGVNVNGLFVGQDSEQRGVALALWNVDSDLDEELVREVQNLPLIESAHLIELEGS